jgi:hypothetical protein
VADLTNVTIETTLGALYVFPDMLRPALEEALRHGAWDEGQLTLVNVSNACLMMPNRIVKTLSFDGQVRWSGPTVRKK